VILNSSIGERRHPIRCINNLREIGIAYRLWANDHNDHFPWADTNIAQNTLQPFEYCLMASNEMNSPKILTCPLDTNRARASVFDANFGNSNISYFFGLNADEAKPNTLLAGDRSLSTNQQILSGVVSLQAAQNVGWAPGLHVDSGVIGMSDGSAEEITTKRIRARMKDGVIVTPTRILIP